MVGLIFCFCQKYIVSCVVSLAGFTAYREITAELNRRIYLSPYSSDQFICGRRLENRWCNALSGFGPLWKASITVELSH